MKIDYRLALDLGTNSIGWCIYKLTRSANDPDDWRISAIQRMGARIFSDGRDPKTLASLAASRREARQARRRRDRTLQRKQQLINLLVTYGLMPSDLAARKALTQLDPYELRAKGLKEPLHPHHFGRAIFHLARKRGFRSGRKDLQTEENEKESGKIDSGIKGLRAKMASTNSKTVGQYLWKLHERREPVLARPSRDGSYPIYLDRALVEDEFNELWAVQASHHPKLLTGTARDKIRHAILFQRKLKPVKPGKCLFERDEERALLAHPLSQRFRILQELANLRIQLSASQERALSRNERDLIASALINGDDAVNDRGLLTWAKLKSKLGLPKQAGFNLDTSGRKGLKADQVSIGLSADGAIGPAWRTWSSSRQDELLKQLRKADRRSDLQELLGAFQFSTSQLDAIFRIAIRMPDDFGSLSLKALERIVPALESDVLHYSDAVRKAGYSDHSNFYDGEILNALPYYGQRLTGYTQPRDLPSANAEEREFGRIPNPTVHVGLNQLRRVVNAIIKRYGHPKQIIVEVARDFGLSGENRRKLEKQQRENRERNEKYSADLAQLGVRNSRENRQRLQLFDEIASNDPLGAECIYTGERISRTKLFSDEIEIDHILPFSRSLDDGIGNKVLCVRRANRDKQNRTPFEAFGHSPGDYSWESIMDRVERLIPRKARRFRERALEDFLNDQDFLARHLSDTAYFSRAAREYLTAICPPNCIWVSTGRMTSMLRGKWGMNRILSDANIKERNDHRHHAVDAAVIGACDRSLIKAIADAAKRAEQLGENRALDRLEPPWPSFFDDVRTITQKIVVSHKPNHSLSGGLHNDTIYGMAEGPDSKGRPLVVHRVPLTSIKKRGDLESIADPTLRRRILDATNNLEGQVFKDAVAKFSVATGIRRVRVLERWSVQPIANPHREKPAYVRTDGNYCYEVIRDTKGKWRGYAISLFEANRLRNLSKRLGAYGDALVMRLHVDDLVAVERPNQDKKIYRIVKVSDAQLALAEHFEAGALKSRDSDPDDNFKYLYASATSLRELKARVVGIDELGYVNDPGFRE